LGVQLGGLVEAKKVSIQDLAGRKVAFDGHNILYQFLAIIRGRGGEPLRDREGNVTSHLSGLIYRNSNLIEAGVRIAYVFDGKPHQFKRQVIRERSAVRREARVKYEEAVREGRVEEARVYAQRAATTTSDIVSDAKRLLTLMGVPWVQAPGEGEAQSSYMANRGDVWAAASQDFDSLPDHGPAHRCGDPRGHRLQPGGSEGGGAEDGFEAARQAREPGGGAAPRQGRGFPPPRGGDQGPLP